MRSLIVLTLVNLPWLLLGIDIVQLDIIVCAVVGLRVSEHTKPARPLSGRAGDGPVHGGDREDWGRRRTSDTPETVYRHVQVSTRDW